METTNINAVEMTRKIREKHAQRLAGKSHAERMAFYRERARKMGKKVPFLLSKLAVSEGRQVEYSAADANTKIVHEKRGKYKTKK
jgi:hypothetical protein